jgi:hypothetical protein
MIAERPSKVVVISATMLAVVAASVTTFECGRTISWEMTTAEL